MEDYTRPVLRPSRQVFSLMPLKAVTQPILCPGKWSNQGSRYHAYILHLLGECIASDVADCIAKVEELINLGLSEAGMQVVRGGSHGGFLSAHRKS